MFKAGLGKAMRGLPGAILGDRIYHENILVYEKANSYDIIQLVMTGDAADLKQRRILSVAVIIALLLGAYFVRMYFGLFVAAGILSYLSYPIYKRISRRTTESKAAAVTMLAVFMIILIPLLITLNLALSQVISFSATVSKSLSSVDINQISADGIRLVNEFLDHIPFTNWRLDQPTVGRLVHSGAEFFGKAAVDFLSSAVGSTIGLVTTSIIFIYVFYSFIRNGDKIIKVVRGLNPLGDEVADLYLTQIGAMVRGTVFGQFVIALVQGLLAAIVVSLATKPSMFFVMLVFFTALSVIPLGAGIVVIPIGIVLVLMGNIWWGVVILLEHLVINTNIDNMLRPILVPKEARLDSALMLVSVFAGIAAFGFIGLVIGPTIMIVIATTIKTYLKVNKNLVFDSPEARVAGVTKSKPVKKKGRK